MHIPVLLDEVINNLNIQDNGIYLDATFGSGGHSKAILSKIGLNGKLFAIDKDPEAVSIAKKIKDPRFFIIHCTFSLMMNYMKKNNLIGKINGILFDLGISSDQIDNPNRGFSFLKNGPLDMRIDPTNGETASEWLSRSSIKEIKFVLKKFGEERFANFISKAIFFYNKKKLINSTHDLANLICRSVPYRDKYKHPATRTFLAIRSYINNELKEINLALDYSLSILSPGGKLLVISFNSLEDKIVKNFIKKHSSVPQTFNNVPFTKSQFVKLQDENITLRSIGKILPSLEERNKNKRSRSAILRIAEKIIS